MHAAVFYSPNNISLEERDHKFSSGDNQRRGVLLRMNACAVCGYDVNVYRNGHIKVRAPVVLGHEICGELAESTSFSIAHSYPDGDVYKLDLVEGTRVVLSPVVPCMNCMYCDSGQYNLCSNLGEIGSSIDGGFAEFVRIPNNTLGIGGLIPLPDCLTNEESTLIEPLACCLNGFKRINSLVNDRLEDKTFVILGDGPIGLIHLQLAKYLYGAKVIVVGRVGHRLQAARNMGADFVLELEENKDTLPTSAIKEVLDLTDGKGTSVSIIATPNPDALEIAAGIASKNSIINIFAGMPRHLSFQLDPNWVHYNQIALIGSFSATPKLIHESITLAAKKRGISLSSIITHRCKLDEIYKALEITEEFLGLRVVINSF
ncbi:MAG: alcohol dehydrogenase catalytic domain-containing protein [Nitrososphaeraceae archaeon]